MKVPVFVKQHSRMTRFKGEFSSLAVFHSALSFPEDTEDARVEGSGSLQKTEEGFLLSFREEGEGGESVSLTYNQKEGFLSITRGQTAMSFLLSKASSFLHRFPLGSLKAEVYTRRLEWKEKEAAGLLTLEYDLCLGGIAQQNRILFHFGEKPHNP